MPSFAAQIAVAFEAEPHQMRSRRPCRVRLDAQQPGRVGEHRPRVGLWRSPRRRATSRNTSACVRAMSASVSPSAGA